jgi:hypothetical protein
MTDWKAITLGSIINAVLTIVLLLAVFPLFFLGPIVGGILTSYLSREYPVFTEKDGAVAGALSGIIGGIIIGLLFIFGFGALSAIIGLIFSQVGVVAGTITIIVGVFITVLSVFIGAVLGAIGGVIGILLRPEETRRAETSK